MKNNKLKPFDPTKLYSMNFNYSGVDIKYDRDDSGCDCSPDYCRCSRIVNARVEKISINGIVDVLFQGKAKDDFLKYCVYQILSHSPYTKPDTYDILTTGGYYGEEIDKVKAKGMKITIDELQNLCALKTNNERLLYVLKHEYGYVLDGLKSLDYTLQNIKVSDIVISQPKHFQKLDKTRIDFYTTEENFTCVCKEEEGVYYLIDGYHRLAAAEKANKTKIEAVVGK